ncbi:hypothetical protein TheveDRAFT_0314 [Thermanaerovibrio velox DSM 12556]|uniref:Uncharacterized protein n=1 Tax=Thermanaerovibrio velox DSM 12556 TaxID=926567 RepID=H0UP71_9BACT|nr:hypothetical protein [Thermanaerovibrio velox]EHM09484.1 hypothetical protein TheveDRAFT_0314 [Thermanaerovibrio velox DSM 12556]
MTYLSVLVFCLSVFGVFELLDLAGLGLAALVPPRIRHALFGAISLCLSFIVMAPLSI